MILPSCLLPLVLPCSQYYNAFRDRHARELALQCFRAMDAAWHSSLYGGYDELPENAIPPSPEPSKGLGSGKASRRELVDTAATSHATDGSDQAPTDHSRGSVMVQHKANGQQPAESARGALRMTRSARRARPEERGSADAARLEAPEKPLRSLNIAMHGLEALTALHKVTKGGLQPGHPQRKWQAVFLLATSCRHTVYVTGYTLVVRHPTDGLYIWLA